MTAFWRKMVGFGISLGNQRFRAVRAATFLEPVQPDQALP